MELFFGIMGGTSTNASLTIEGIRFYSIVPPALAISARGGEAVVSWPMWASNYVLQAAANLDPAEDWRAVDGAPALLGFENVVTNAIDLNSRFYRLHEME